MGGKTGTRTQGPKRRDYEHLWNPDSHLPEGVRGTRRGHDAAHLRPRRYPSTTSQGPIQRLRAWWARVSK